MNSELEVGDLAYMPNVEQGTTSFMAPQIGEGTNKRKLADDPTTNHVPSYKQRRLNIVGSNWNLDEATGDGAMEENNACDNNVPRSYYDLREIQKTTAERFNLEVADLQVRFRNMDKITAEEFPVKVHDILCDMFANVINLSDPDMKIRIHMDADGLTTPYNGKFIRVSEFDADKVITSLGKILNSNQKILLEGGELRINIIRVKLPPSGGARRHMNNRSTIDIPTWSNAKRSLVTILNDDNLCMARALVVARAAVVKDTNPTLENMKKYNQLRRSERLAQRIEAEALHAAAGVPLGPCGVDEAQVFQTFLSEYQILIYAAHIGNKRIFTGPSKPDRIALFLHDSHYDAIVSLTGFLGCSYVCAKCLAPTNDLRRHACTISCYACKSTECTHTAIEAKLLCNDCNRFFYDDDCIKMHKVNRTCTRKVRCTHCHRAGHKGPNKMCFKKKCATCGKYQDVAHLCYIQKEDNTVTKPTKKLPPVRFFYDFECTQETGTHTPNLVICKGEDDLHKEFYGPHSRDDFCEWIFKENCGLKRESREKIFIAHYAKAYDSFLILDYLHRKNMFVVPIKCGLKILSLHVEAFEVRFLDSHSFLPMPLAKFPDTFGLTELKKGYFPHYFNTVDNQNYNGQLPEERFYGADTMTVANRSKFQKWYAEEKAKFDNDPLKTFNMKDELIAYCNSDVQILKESCMCFREEFIETTKVDPFSAITIAAVCHKVFRTHILKPYTIGIVPQEGYCGRRQQSDIALRWMGWLSHKFNLNIVNALSLEGEAKIGNYYVDGLCRETKTIYEFHGCYYHGCQRCYGPRENNLRLGSKMADLFAATLDKERYLAQMASDHKLVRMWECEFVKVVRMDVEMADFVQKMVVPEPINPRDAFYGGRTHAARLYAKVGEGEAIRYYDFVSLYPTINKFGKMPVGHPEPIFPATYAKDQYFGLIKATVLPPRRLYHPVLPFRVRGKLMFPLCRRCAEENVQDTCHHGDCDRQITATWCTPEVDVALDEGYKIITVHGVWHYAKHAEYGSTIDHPQGLFGDYVDMFLKIKQQASGWPLWVKTDEDQDKFIEDYFANEKVKLDKTEVKKNPGKRALAKLCLNSFWGRFGMREDIPQTEYVQSYDRFVELLTSPKYIVSDANIVNQGMILVSYKLSKDFISGSSHTNVVIAAFTTTMARLKLYEVLRILGERALYMDTDSVIFISPRDSDPIAHYLGDNLGKMTDEIGAEYGDGAYIEEFVSGGPKNYGYRVSNGTTTFKVKGITQNFQNSGKVNFHVMLDLIHGFVREGEITKIVLDENKIKRNMLKASLTNVNRTRTYKIVYDKAVVGPNYTAFPFGY